MSDLGICEYCKYLDKDVTQNPCLHCSSNLGAFEFDISEHDKKIIADERERIIAELEELRDRFDKNDFAIRGILEKAIEIVGGDANE